MIKSHARINLILIGQKIRYRKITEIRILKNHVHRYRNCICTITKYHPLVINKKLSTQIQHKFNKFNEIWPKLTNFLPELSTQIEHKLNTNFSYDLFMSHPYC